MRQSHRLPQSVRLARLRRFLRSVPHFQYLLLIRSDRGRPLLPLHRSALLLLHRQYRFHRLLLSDLNCQLCLLTPLYPLVPVVLLIRFLLLYRLGLQVLLIR
jgi:hypothetical protein